MRTISAVLFFLLANLAHATDWQFGGGAKIENEYSLSFFDADNIQRPKPGIARVWTHVFKQKVLDQYWNKQQKVIVEKAARKVVVGYLPNYFLLDDIKRKYQDEKALFDDAVLFTGYETIANSGNAAIDLKMYYEFDCIEKRYRILHVSAYGTKGIAPRNFDTPNAAFVFTPPETNVAWLTAMVCINR